VKHAATQELKERLNMNSMHEVTDSQLNNIFQVETNVWSYLIRNEIDDVRHRLNPALRKRVDCFEKKFWDTLTDRAQELTTIVANNISRDKHNFAQNVARFHPAGPALFTIFKTADATVGGAAWAILRQLRKRASTVSEARHILGDPFLSWDECA
jgi:hypothetical protein